MNTENPIKLIAILALLNLCIACSDKAVTDFSDKTPAVVSSEEKSELAQELAIQYSGFSEAQQSLEVQIGKLTALEKIAGTQINLSLEIETANSENQEQETRFTDDNFNLPTKEELASSQNSFLDSLNLVMDQILSPPASTLILSAQTNQFHKVPVDHYQLSQAVIENITFLNGEKSTTPITHSDLNSNLATFNKANGKVIESLSARLDFQYPLEYSEIILSDAKPSVNIDGHEITFKRVAKNKLELSYPPEIEERLVYSNAWHKNGKALEIKSHSGRTMPDTETLEYMAMVNELYQDTLKKLNKGVFESAGNLQAYITERMPTEPEEIISTVTDLSTYHGPVYKARLVLRSAKTQTLSKTFLATNSKLERNQTGYYPALDKETKKYGLVSKLGEWTVKPTYSYLQYKTADFFGTPGTEQYHRLNIENKSLQLVDYQPRELISNNLILIYKPEASENSESRNWNVKGVLNLTTNQEIVSANFYDIEKDGELLTVQKHTSDFDDYYGVYDITGKELLPTEYARIDIENELIYATLRTENKSRTLVYDKNAVQITPPEWYAVREFGEDDLLLVKKCETQTDVDLDHTWEKCVYKFINKKGEFAFDLDQYDYISLSPFSNGYAAIENKNDLWGYINTKGKLIIPFKYKIASRFHKKYALVTAKNGDEMLIDSKGRVFKNFKDNIRQHQSGYAEYDIYLLKDGSRYSGDGKLLPDNESD